MRLAAAVLVAIACTAAVQDAFRGVDGVVLLADVSTGRMLASHNADKARAVAPGSTIKPFTMMALIDQGALTSNMRIACSGELRIGLHRLDCSHPRLAAPLDAEAALAYSCNTYFAETARRLDPVRFASFLEAWGFDVTPPSNEDQRRLQAIGEYGVRITPARMLIAYRRLALTASKYPSILLGLEGAVSFGSAQLAALPGVTVAGKTGTTANALRTATHAWFAGFAPSKKPEAVIVVFLESGKGGPSAAPVAANVLAQWRGDPRAFVVRTRTGATQVVDLETYVRAVLAGEASDFPAEAMKAQAVAARTYAVANRGRHRREGYDFCDTSHCQNLRFGSDTNRIVEAADATEGQLLWYEGRPAQTFYHRHCGGVTEAAEALWPSLRAPYLRQQTDTFCVSSGKAPWRVQLTGRSVEIAGRTPSGRISRLRLDGRIVTVEAVQAELRLLSAMFDVRRQGAAVVVEGYGAGHGVGMCQTGAVERARHGQSWRQILDFYYPGTTPGLTAQGLTWTLRGGERIELWSTRPQQDGPVLATAERMLREAERRAGRAYQGRPRLRVYPDVATFRDATGEPGWVAASTRGGTVRMQPTKTAPEAVLLHEMLHLVLDQQSRAGLPLWFREGVALWLADPDKPASSAAWGDLESAASEAELRRAYDAARSRVKLLADRNGRQSVLHWVEAGLPQAASDAIKSQQKTRSK